MLELHAASEHDLVTICLGGLAALWDSGAGARARHIVDIASEVPALANVIDSTFLLACRVACSVLTHPPVALRLPRGGVLEGGTVAANASTNLTAIGSAFEDTLGSVAGARARI